MAHYQDDFGGPSRIMCKSYSGMNRRLFINFCVLCSNSTKRVPSSLHSFYAFKNRCLENEVNFPYCLQLSIRSTAQLKQWPCDRKIIEFFSRKNMCNVNIWWTVFKTRFWMDPSNITCLISCRSWHSHKYFFVVVFIQQRVLPVSWTTCLLSYVFWYVFFGISPIYITCKPCEKPVA